MAKKKHQSTVVVVLNTDLENTKPFDEDSLDEIQRQTFSQLNEDVRDKIREGYAVVINDIESGETLTAFNMEGYRPPQRAIDSLARALLPRIKEYYRTHPEALSGNSEKETEDK
ncbi:MAG: hypothetical protein IKG85_01260 [Clostridia bacterium]|nr:hypothetical protein [Clostridia bacterium]